MVVKMSKKENNKGQNQDKDNPLIDPNVKEELTQNLPEDPLITEYATQNSTESENSERVKVTSNWIGEKGNWKVKTKLSAEQIIAMTQTRMLPQVFEELEPISEQLLKAVENLEQYSISHGGLGREQQVSVLRSMHSGEFSEDEHKRNMLLESFAMTRDNEE